MGKGWLRLTVSALTCFLVLLPLTSAFDGVSNNKRRALWTTVKSSGENIGRRNHQQARHLVPEHLATEVMALISAAMAAVEVERDDSSGKSGSFSLLRNGVGQIITGAGLVFAFNMVLGDKISNDIRASKSEIVVLGIKTDASIRTLSSTTDTSIAKLDARIEKLEAGIDKLSTKTEASIERLEAIIDKLSGEREASIDKARK
jgi:cell division protein FtsB